MLQTQEYNIKVSEQQISDLKRRLSDTRYPDQVDGACWSYGSELNTVKASGKGRGSGMEQLTRCGSEIYQKQNIIFACAPRRSLIYLESFRTLCKNPARSLAQEYAQYWERQYDWRRAEQYLRTKFHHYALSGAQALDQLHFLHERSPRADARPLLLIHGWPGSFYEFHKIIPMLTNPGPDKPAFHVVAPSLPGFGFSSPPKTTGFGLRAIASLFHTLMLHLGYKTYFSQGGDWGAVLSKALGTYHSQGCKAIHINTNMSAPVKYNPLHTLQSLNAAYFPAYPIFLNREEITSLQTVFNFLSTGNGYFAIQSTRPQTLGYAMEDSPTGILAWILEKFFEWTDNGGNLDNSVSKDDLLTNVSLYWFTKRATSSFRIYYESTKLKEFERLLNSYCPTPTAISAFAVDINAPGAWARSRYNLQQYRTYPHGGHFAALEQPDRLCADIQAFLATQKL